MGEGRGEGKEGTVGKEDVVDVWTVSTQETFVCKSRTIMNTANF